MREWEEPATLYKDAQPLAARLLDWQVRLLFRIGAYAGVIGAVLATAVVFLAGATENIVLAALVGVIALAAVFTIGCRVFLQRKPPANRWTCRLWRVVYALVAAVSALIWGVLAGLAFAAWPEPQAIAIGVLVLLGLVTTLLVAAFWLPLGVGALLLFSYSAWRSIGSPVIDDWSGPGGILTLLSGLLLVAVVWGSAMSRWLLRALADQDSRSNIIGEMQRDLVEQERQIKVESDHRNRVERELTLAHDAAESAIRAKTEFLATMSHEIRTPLNGILPILELLLDTPLSTDQREYVDTAHKSSRHLLRLINDVLDFAKVEAGKLELEYIEIELDELIESVTNLMRRTAERKGLELQVSIDSEAPDAVRGDPIRLRQVLTNLVSNAVKFTDSGSVRVEIKQLRVGRKEVNLRFSVIDTGVGMSAGTAKRLFQSFTQADASTTRKHGGTGLGLVICKRLVELMGGEIGVHSAPEKGSTFWFELPMRRSKHDIPPARQDLSDVRLLTVIKDPQERAQVSAWLDGWRIMEERAESAIAAISKLKTSAMLGESWAFELVLADTRGQDQAVTTIVRELRAEPELALLPVVVAGPGVDASLTEHPNVVLIDAPIQKQELRRVFVRVLDVAELGADSSGLRDDSKPLFDVFQDDAPALVSAGENVATDKLSGRVLLAEDNPVNSAVARKLLQHIGVDCVIAEDGVAALDCLEVDQFDLVLMDVQMPNMDGFEATAEIRKREAAGRLKRMPIIAITANVMRGDKEKCLAGGMDDYLSKPLDMDILKEVLARWLNVPSLAPHTKEQASVPAAISGRDAADSVIQLRKPGVESDDAMTPLEDLSLDNDLIIDIGKIADSVSSSWGASKNNLSIDGGLPSSDLKAEGLDDGESAEPQVAQVHAEWDDIGDDFPDLDSELVRDLAEDNLDYDEYVTKDTQAPQSRPAEKPGTNNQASGVGDAIEDALVANNMNRTESRSERPDALAADSTEFKAPMEAESMPTDLDWLASHEQTVEVIEITSDGAAPHGDLESKADMASTTEGRETERDQMRTGTDLSELDLAVLEDLREVMEDQFYSVLASYLKNAPMQLEILEDAAKAGDIDTMVRPAHSLKSSSANVGARRVSELAKEIESNARERLRTAAVAALPELREALDAASQQLAEIALGS